MIQKDLFGEYVDTLEERARAQALADEYGDLIEEMEADFESDKYKPYIEKLERNLHPVDFLNMYKSSANSYLFCKNTIEVKDIFKVETCKGITINYNKIIADYKKWKEENHNG